MNTIEQLKSKEDGLSVYARIAQYAKQGWESIPDDDIQRLKWYGIFLRNPTPGKFMLRVRIPGGQTTIPQLSTLAQIAQTYGNEVLDVTTRQQIQLRNLSIEHIPTIFSQFETVGLSSIQTGMDNVRNILTCPISGISPDEIGDTMSLVTAMTQLIAHNASYSNLPRKMNVAITGCPHNCVHLETQDLAFVPARYTLDHGDSCAGYNVLVGGKLGSGGYRIASSLDLFVMPDEVLSVFETILQLYRDHGFRENRNQSRLSFLIDDWGEERFRLAIETQLRKTFPREGTDLRQKQTQDHIGIYRQRQKGLNYVGIKLLVGRTTSDELHRIVDLASRYGSQEIRLTPHQSLVIPHIPDHKIGDLDEELRSTTLTYNPTPITKGLVSCVGSDYCNLAVIETKQTAVDVARALEKRLPSTIKPITMHWSGCPASCGNHVIADIGLLGKKVKIDGKVTEAVDIFVGGKSGPDPKLAIKIMEDVPCSRLPDVLANVIPYHTREKMHRVRSISVKKSANTTVHSSTVI